jgi:hypothetical protein
MGTLINPLFCLTLEGFKHAASFMVFMHALSIKKHMLANTIKGT